MRFFIMMNDHTGAVDGPMIESDGSDKTAYFSTLEAAHEAAKSQPFAQAFGYEVFEVGSGDKRIDYEISKIHINN